MKVAILTMFNGLSSTYSLVNVVAEQAKMMLEANIDFTIFVSENCPDSERSGIFLDERIKWKKIVNQFSGTQIKWYDYSKPFGKVHSTFYQEVDVIADDLEKKLLGFDVCIMHDIHYQGWHLLHNVAIRKVQKNLTDLRFIAFTHSAPVNRPTKLEWPFSARYMKMPNTIYVYPTDSGIPHLAKQYDIPEEICKVVNNSLDLLNFLDPSVQKIAKTVDLLSPEIIVIYPARLTTGKKFEKVASLCGIIKTISNKQLKLIFCDFPSSDIQSTRYKRKIIRDGMKNGLDKSDIVFTTDLGYELGFPRKGVLDLFTVSNLFICPSYSESFGLTVLEAASRGNFIVVNEAVPALKELGEQLQTYFLRWDARNFGFDTKETYHPTEEAYFQDHASNILQLMTEDQTLYSKTMAKQRYSPNWIWKNQLEPIIFGKW